MVAVIFCVNTPTRQPPSSFMPTEPDGVVPVKLQTNLVPLYLPATTSPGPVHWPSTDLKKLGRVRAAESSAGALAITAADNGRKTDSNARIIERNPATEGDEGTPRTLKKIG